jgi:hypothetical protein
LDNAKKHINKDLYIFTSFQAAQINKTVDSTFLQDTHSFQSRINRIREFVFDKDATFYPGTCETIVQIVIIICFYNFKLAVTKIFPALFRGYKRTRKIEHALIAVRAIKVLIELNVRFEGIMETSLLSHLVESNTDNISELAQFCDAVVGLNVSGPRKRFLPVDQILEEYQGSLMEISDFINDVQSETQVFPKVYVTEIIASPFRSGYEYSKPQNPNNFAVDDLYPIELRYTPLLEEGIDSISEFKDDELVVNLTCEILQVVHQFPLYDLHYGKFFLGTFLLNNNDQIAKFACVAILNLYTEDIIIKFKILNAFLNLLKMPKLQDTSSLVQILNFLKCLLTMSLKSSVNWESIGNEAVRKLKEKMDFIVLYLLSHPNPIVRQLTFDICMLAKRVFLSIVDDSEEPAAQLHEILEVEKDNQIVKFQLRDILSSNYHILWAQYYFEICKKAVELIPSLSLQTKQLNDLLSSATSGNMLCSQLHR